MGKAFDLLPAITIPHLKGNMQPDFGKNDKI
jgi:hypothetical protein